LLFAIDVLRVEITGTTAVLGDFHTMTCGVTGFLGSANALEYEWRSDGAVVTNSAQNLFPFVIVADARGYECRVRESGTLLAMGFSNLSVTS
jgi:hypothetical protein